MQLDSIDLRILDHLQRDGSLTNVELARRVHLSPSPCLTRVKALEAAGVIERYVALANAKALGLGLNVFISISLKEQGKESLAEFERRIVEHEQRYHPVGAGRVDERGMVADAQVAGEHHHRRRPRAGHGPVLLHRPGD